MRFQSMIISKGMQRDSRHEWELQRDYEAGSFPVSQNTKTIAKRYCIGCHGPNGSEQYCEEGVWKVVVRCKEIDENITSTYWISCIGSSEWGIGRQ